MSPKHEDKFTLVLMLLVLILTFSLAFMFKVVHKPKEQVVQIVYVEVPRYVREEEPRFTVPLESEPVVEELEGAELYASYVDEITSTIYTDIDPMLVKAIIYHESRYVPDVVNSSSGTAGLMQVSTKWHTERARKLGVDDLLDPYGNILVGCDILSELYQSYGRSYSLNVYAGGYNYANSYKGRKSPYEKAIENIKFGLLDGSITIGGD